MDSGPAGCSSAKLVRSYTVPWMATQQSSGVLCSANSEGVTVRSLGAGVSGEVLDSSENAGEGCP